MARGRTNSALSLSARRTKAIELFVKGYTPAEVAREIQVTPDTAARYRRKYEAEIAAQAKANPQLLRNMLANTVRALQELELVRQEGWKQYEQASTPAQKATFLGIVRQAQADRAKLYGLVGVKAEVLQQVAAVREQQEKLMEFMRSHLCPADRLALEAFIIDQFAEELAEMPTAAGVDS